MKKLVINGIALLVVLAGFRTAYAGGYEYTIDLTDVQDDRLRVELTAFGFTSDEVEFHMPKIVPGTYSISDFGRFVSELEAIDTAGKALEVERLSVNRWKVSNAKALKKLTYWVEDTWDTDKDDHIFEPGGTNIEAGKNFVINTFGFFGYFEGMKDDPIVLRIKKPANFYGSTSLIAASSKPTEDVYEIGNYHLLADSPLMYCEPDTAIRKVGGADVLVSVYSPNKRAGADAIMAEIAEILVAQKEYLGGSLPVGKYAFLIYLTDRMGGSGGMGALEHSYSSLYYMPETDDEAAGEMLRDVAAHEFFHIVTPLSIHSEEIHYFDYIDPKMSRHLWLYEGVTEYSAGHVQVRHDLITVGEYFGVLRSKLIMSAFFHDTVPFTEISAGCLDEYKDQYLNVYQKGALIGMSVDILLRKYTDGEIGLQELMRELAKTYGKSQPFRDEELFDKIAELSHPDIRQFFRDHVEGPEPIPYDEIFGYVGVRYEPVANRKVLSTGRIALKFNDQTGRFIVVSTDRVNKMGKKMRYKEGDEIVKFDGMEVTRENYEEVIAKYRGRHAPGDKIYVEVARPDGNGGYKMKTLKARAEEGNFRGMHMLSLDPDATEEQVRLRNSWLGG